MHRLLRLGTLQKVVYVWLNGQNLDWQYVTVAGDSERVILSGAWRLPRQNLWVQIDHFLERLPLYTTGGKPLAQCPQNFSRQGVLRWINVTLLPAQVNKYSSPEKATPFSLRYAAKSLLHKLLQRSPRLEEVLHRW